MYMVNTCTTYICVRNWCTSALIAVAMANSMHVVDKRLNVMLV